MRSYPTSEVRGSGQECQAATAQERPRGATPRPRPGAVAGRTHPTPEVRGGSREDLPHAQGQGIGRDKQPHIQGAVAAQAEGLKELFHVRR